MFLLNIMFVEGPCLAGAAWFTIIYYMAVFFDSLVTVLCRI